jgi:hypothetical protein
MHTLVVGINALIKHGEKAKIYTRGSIKKRGASDTLICMLSLLIMIYGNFC